MMSLQQTGWYEHQRSHLLSSIQLWQDQVRAYLFSFVLVGLLMLPLMCVGLLGFRSQLWNHWWWPRKSSLQARCVFEGLIEEETSGCNSLMLFNHCGFKPDMTQKLQNTAWKLNMIKKTCFYRLDMETLTMQFLHAHDSSASRKKFKSLFSGTDLTC